MINLSNTVINEGHIEEAYLKTGTRTCDGGYYIKVNDIHYWSPTKVGVVVHYRSGRVSVYGGEDANCIWVTLQDRPAHVDIHPYKVLEGRGLKIKVRPAGSNSEALVRETYDWVAAPGAGMTREEEVASAFIHLLVDNGYIPVSILEGLGVSTEAQFNEGGISIVENKGYGHSSLVMRYTPDTEGGAGPMEVVESAAPIVRHVGNSYSEITINSTLREQCLHRGGKLYLSMKGYIDEEMTSKITELIQHPKINHMLSLIYMTCRSGEDFRSVCYCALRNDPDVMGSRDLLDVADWVGGRNFMAINDRPMVAELA